MSKIHAFISCSLRNEDSRFVNFVENVLRKHGVTPMGTVGRHNATTQNPAEAMKQNIAQSDFVVVCATKRYVQIDTGTKAKTSGILEMLQFESGMAHATDKPLIVFLEEGVNVG